jgi:hypothetical protein
VSEHPTAGQIIAEALQSAPVRTAGESEFSADQSCGKPNTELPQSIALMRRLLALWPWNPPQWRSRRADIPTKERTMTTLQAFQKPEQIAPLDFNIKDDVLKAFKRLYEELHLGRLNVDQAWIEAQALDLLIKFHAEDRSLTEGKEDVPGFEDDILEGAERDCEQMLRAMVSANGPGDIRAVRDLRTSRMALAKLRLRHFLLLARKRGSSHDAAEIERLNIEVWYNRRTPVEVERIADILEMWARARETIIGAEVQA